MAIVIASVGIVGAKAMLGDQATELPLEEQAEKSLNLQEKYEPSEYGESEADEASERAP